MTNDFRCLELPRRYANWDPNVSITETATEKRPSRIFRILREGKKPSLSTQTMLANQYRDEFDKQQKMLSNAHQLD